MGLVKTIDAHQHFWKFDPIRDNWITNEMSAIKRDFLPGDLAPILQQNGFDGCIAVQASQSEEETDFLISLARHHDLIKGIVGWVDLQAANITDRLAQYKSFPIVKGFSHVLKGEPQRDLMLRHNFKRGLAALQQNGFVYDILVFPDQLKVSAELVASYPAQTFVIDHIGKPYVKRKEVDEWKTDMESIASHQNAYCKISGMVTEADWNNWTNDDFKPYLDVVIDAFGPKRIMFGSDWPVCLVAASYEKMLGIVSDYFSAFSKEEQDQFFGLNAIAFYNL